MHLLRLLVRLAPLLIAAALLPAASAPSAQDGRNRPPPLEDTETVHLFRLRSPSLTAFWGREMFLEAGVVQPADLEPGDRLPVVYRIHGFGGSHRSAWREGPGLVADMESGKLPRMLHVFLNGQFSLGHHEFADSVNNGPWGAALTTEFVPAVEEAFEAYGAPHGRFLTGHSSGGWSSLWLQVTYPDFFDGTWSTAPDSVDFRDFTGIDVYAFENAYRDPEDREIMLVRRQGEFVSSIREYVERELAESDHGGQFASFNAVFSPRGEDGRPQPLFDPATGVIDRAVAETWRKYDIGLILRRDWAELGPRLAGKLHVYCGTIDTFRLEGAARLLQQDLAALGSDGQVLLVEGRDHGNLFGPHPELWPDGMMNRILLEMGARFAAHGASR